jgi:hypothetical protein
MLHAVARLEATRDKLNPDVASVRQVDLNLADLKAWRNSSATVCAALPLRGRK